MGFVYFNIRITVIISTITDSHLFLNDRENFINKNIIKQAEFYSFV